MRRRAIWGLLCAALAFAQCVEVSDELLEAGALGVPALAGSREPAGWAPAPGAVRHFSARQVNALLRRAGRTETVSKGVCVVREARPLEREQVLAALQAAWDEAGVSIELVSFSDRPAPRGRIEFPVGGLQRGAGTAPDFWRGRVVYGTGKSMPIWARVHLSVERRALAPVADLAAGSVLARESVREVSLRAHPLARLADPAAGVAGARARRHLLAGVPLLADDLWFPPAVRSGDALTLEVAEGGARLRLPVRAEAAGQIGDRIPARNLQNGRRIRIRVTGKGAAEPAL
jgi:flagella basal body P-ring formation protein FlgA